MNVVFLVLGFLHGLSQTAQKLQKPRKQQIFITLSFKYLSTTLFCPFTFIVLLMSTSCVYCLSSSENSCPIQLILILRKIQGALSASVIC